MQSAWTSTEEAWYHFGLTHPMAASARRCMQASYQASYQADSKLAGPDSCSGSHACRATECIIWAMGGLALHYFNEINKGACQT